MAGLKAHGITAVGGVKYRFVGGRVLLMVQLVTHQIRSRVFKK
jgi:hypothetical protein